jgi:hypothetical protein
MTQDNSDDAEGKYKYAYAGEISAAMAWSDVFFSVWLPAVGRGGGVVFIGATLAYLAGLLKM